MKPTFDEMVARAKVDALNDRGPVNCTYILAASRKAYPRTCGRCGIGPCPFYSASVDTHPEGGDALAAPFMSGAVPEGETPQ